MYRNVSYHRKRFIKSKRVFCASSDNKCFLSKTFINTTHAVTLADNSQLLKERLASVSPFTFMSLSPLDQPVCLAYPATGH